MVSHFAVSHERAHGFYDEAQSLQGRRVRDVVQGVHLLTHAMVIYGTYCHVFVLLTKKQKHKKRQVVDVGYPVYIVYRYRSEQKGVVVDAFLCFRSLQTLSKESRASRCDRTKEKLSYLTVCFKTERNTGE